MSKTKIDVQAAMVASQQIGATVAALCQRRSDLSSEAERLHQDSAMLYRQPLRPSEIKPLIMCAIDQWGKEFLDNWINVLRDFGAPKGMRPNMEGPISMEPWSFAPSSAAITLQDAEAALGGESSRVFAVAYDPPSNSVPPTLDPWRNIVTGAMDPTGSLDARMNQSHALKSACFFYGEQIKAKVEKHFEDAFPPVTGVDDEVKPASERLAMIIKNKERGAAIEQEIAAIDADLKALDWSPKQGPKFVQANR